MKPKPLAPKRYIAKGKTLIQYFSPTKDEAIEEMMLYVFCSIL
jgi:hypothetical protein